MYRFYFAGGLGDILPLLMISGGDFGGNMLGGMALMQGLSGGGGGGREGGGRGGRGGMRSLMRSPFGLMGATGALGNYRFAFKLIYPGLRITNVPLC